LIKNNSVLPNGDKNLSVYIKESKQPAQACVIWMHGLGADASDMAGLAEQLTVKDVDLRHVFIDAPLRSVTLNGGAVMPAWYDIVGLNLTDRSDRLGIEQSEDIIRKVMDAQLIAGFKYNQIFLAGFSQGGAMALHTALNTSARLAGVIALSAYLPLGTQSHVKLNTETPFFIASGQFDPLVLPTWTKQSEEWLSINGYGQLAVHQYPMEHSICYEEIKDMSLWLSDKVQELVQ
jgi:phospholipase/carboxylesterase